MKNRVEITLTKEVKDLCAENYNTLIKKLKMRRANGELVHTLGL